MVSNCRDLTPNHPKKYHSTQFKARFESSLEERAMKKGQAHALEVSLSLNRINMCIVKIVKADHQNNNQMQIKYVIVAIQMT
jgi:hypothetical protein